MEIKILDRYINGEDDLLKKLVLILSSKKNKFKTKQIKTITIVHLMKKRNYLKIKELLDNVKMDTSDIVIENNIDEILFSIDYEAFETSFVRIFFDKFLKDEHNHISMARLPKNTKYEISRMLMYFLFHFTNIKDIIPYRDNELKKSSIVLEKTLSNKLYFYAKMKQYVLPEQEIEKNKKIFNYGRIHGCGFVSEKYVGVLKNKVNKTLFEEDINDLILIYQ